MLERGGGHCAQSMTEKDIAGYPYAGRHDSSSQWHWPAAVVAAECARHTSGPCEQDVPNWVGPSHLRVPDARGHMRCAAAPPWRPQKMPGKDFRDATVQSYFSAGAGALAAPGWGGFAEDAWYPPGAGATAWEHHRGPGPPQDATHWLEEHKSESMPMQVRVANAQPDGRSWQSQQHNGGVAARTPSQGVAVTPAEFQQAVKNQAAAEQQEWLAARWHKSAESVGELSEEDHVFTKNAGPRLKRTHVSGAGYELATICMVFDASLRCGGAHTYRFCFLDGELGPADGAGFVFDTKVRRRPLGQMHAVFLNQRGFVCLRKGQQVSRLPVQLPRLTLGMKLTMRVNLDRYSARFDITDPSGTLKGSADVGLEGLFEGEPQGVQLRSGFFCAVVTGNITVGLY